MGDPRKAAKTKPQDNKHQRAYDETRADKRMMTDAEKIEYAWQQGHAQAVLNNTQAITDIVAKGHRVVYDSLLPQILNAHLFVPSAFSSLVDALGFASQDFSNITGKKKGEDRDLGEAIFGTLLGIATIVAPELACVVAAGKEVKEVQEAMKARVEIVKTAGELYFNIGKLVKDAVEENPYLAEGYRVGAVKALLEVLDKAKKAAFDKLTTADNLLGQIRIGDSAAIGKVQSILKDLSIPAEFKTADAKTVVDNLGSCLNTSLYSDIFLYDMLKEYTRRYVVVECNVVYIAALVHGIDDPDLVDLDDEEHYHWAYRAGFQYRKLTAEVKGMDGRDLVYGRLGLKGPFIDRLMKSGRPPISSFRDLVKVWGARFQDPSGFS